MENTERYISFINSNIFFKEFTFSRNDFTCANKNQVQLADNVVWLDDIFFVYQIKERDLNSTGSEDEWFKNKVLKKAKNQIKGTLKYINSNKKIEIQNERGHKLNIANANTSLLKKIIIYNSTKLLSEEFRLLKFYRSKEIGLINLFNIEDYKNVCRFLQTPAEIHEYLSFREELYEKHEQELNSLPEQYVLAHFLGTTQTETINLSYLDNLVKLENNILDFDISIIIENFQNRIIKIGEDKDYYLIIKELAKLDRAELREYKLRFDYSLKNAEAQNFVVPYRMTCVSTGCGFVFIPMRLKDWEHWSSALSNLTHAHKYEQKLTKCIGMIVCHDKAKKFYDINWSFIEFDWKFNAELDKMLKENFPFRETNLKQINRYRFGK